MLTKFRTVPLGNGESTLYALASRMISHYCHQDKSKPEQECTRLVLAREHRSNASETRPLF